MLLTVLRNIRIPGGFSFFFAVLFLQHLSRQDFFGRVSFIEFIAGFLFFFLRTYCAIAVFAGDMECLLTMCLEYFRRCRIGTQRGKIGCLFAVLYRARGIRWMQFGKGLHFGKARVHGMSR